MTQDATNGVQVSPRRKQDRGTGMTKIMEVQIRHSGFHTSAAEAGFKPFAIDGERDKRQPSAHRADNGYGSRFQRLGISGV